MTDTKAHLDYFRTVFNFGEKKAFVSFVGADEDVFVPRERQVIGGRDKFKVFFYGSFVPLQGIEYIIKAAKLLEEDKDIEFDIVGDGYTFNEVKSLAEKLNIRNVNFMGRVDFSELPGYILEADVCLGIFGRTDKAKIVIPNKVYHGLAMGLCILTGDSEAAREILVDGKDASLCGMSDERSIADAIKILKEDSKLRRNIAEAGRKTYLENWTTQVVGNRLSGFLEGISK